MREPSSIEKLRASKDRAAIYSVLVWVPFERLLVVDMWVTGAYSMATLALLVRMVALQGWSWSLVIVGWFVGNNSGWGTLVVAHELIHRRERPLRWLGRALLCTVLYDHFFVEHAVPFFAGHRPHERTQRAVGHAIERRLIGFGHGQLRQPVDRLPIMVGALPKRID